MSNPALSNCPFCGAGATSIKLVAREFGGFWAGCHSCGGAGPVCGSVELAANAWNLRIAPLDFARTLERENTELRAQLASVKPRRTKAESIAAFKALTAKMPTWTEEDEARFQAAGNRPQPWITYETSPAPALP